MQKYDRGIKAKGGERASGKSISKEAPAALHPVLWEWEDCMTWSETLCQHPADCTARQTHVSRRHGREGKERRLCIPEGLCLGPGGFATTRSPGVTDRQYESVNQTVYHAEEVTCGEAASFLCLVTCSLTCTECLLVGEAGITASGTTTPPIPQSSLGEQAGWAPGMANGGCYQCWQATHLPPLQLCPCHKVSVLGSCLHR